MNFLQAVHKTFHNLLLLLSVFDMVRTIFWHGKIHILISDENVEFLVFDTFWKRGHKLAHIVKCWVSADGSEEKYNYIWYNQVDVRS